MSRHELPSGGCVYLRDEAMLRAKDMKKIMRSVQGGKNDPSAGALAAGLAVTDGVIAAMVTEWELPYLPDPLPDGSPRMWVLPSADPSIVDELSMGDYNRLAELVQDAQKAAFPTKPDPTDFEDPTSPTGPANA